MDPKKISVNRKKELFIIYSIVRDGKKKTNPIEKDHWVGAVSPPKRIYIIYMGSRRGIYSYIAASTSDLVRPRPSASDEPNPRSRGYIAVYSPPRPHIYITYMFVYTNMSKLSTI